MEETPKDGKISNITIKKKLQKITIKERSGSHDIKQNV